MVLFRLSAGSYLAVRIDNQAMIHYLVICDIIITIVSRASAHSWVSAHIPLFKGPLFSATKQEQNLFLSEFELVLGCNYSRLELVLRGQTLLSPERVW